MLKRYLVFGFDNYYPSGGWSDFLGSFDSTAEAFAALRLKWDNKQVIDSHTGLEVTPQ
jgi:hypothetical protein